MSRWRKPFCRSAQALSLLFVFGAWGLRAAAEDLTTLNGRTFHSVQVLSRNASNLYIRSNEGETEIGLDQLKAADREKYSKNLIKSIELPAVTVIGENKPEFNAEAERSRVQAMVDRDLRRQALARREAAQERAEHPPFTPVQLTRNIGFSLGATNPRSDLGLQPDYLRSDYQQLAPEIVEKGLREFSLSLQQP